MIKNASQLVFITIFASLSFFSLRATTSESNLQEAHEWAYNSFFASNSTINTQERDIILNYIYCAYWRSRATIEAQKVVAVMLETVWQGWQNIARTRMNPSHKPPYLIDYKAQEDTFKKFQNVQKKHQAHRQTYDVAAEYTVKGTHSKAHTNAVTLLRDRARQIIIKEFFDIKKALGELFEFACHQVRLNNTILDETRFDYLDTLISLIPASYAMNSFIEAEKLQTQASDATWQTLQTIIMVNQKIWETVETARMNYYATYYDVVIQYLEKNNLPMPPLLFCEFGLFPSEQLNRSYSLPKNITNEPVHLFSLMS